MKQQRSTYASVTHSINGIIATAFIIEALILLILIDDSVAQQPIGNQLRLCRKSLHDRFAPSDVCVRRRLKFATHRHKPIVMEASRKPRLVILNCPICYESNRTEFVWKFVARNVEASIFRQMDHPIYDNYWVLQPNFGPVPSYTEGTICLDPMTHALVLHVQTQYPLWGTYVCSMPSDNTHPANYIWYHVDFVSPVRANLRQVPFPPRSGTRHLVESAAQYNQIQTEARRTLERYMGWKEERVGPFLLTSLLSEPEAFASKCGPIKVQLYRQCYVRVPTKRPAIAKSDVLLQMYDFVREAFDFVVAFRESNTSVSARQEALTRRSVRQLGFQLHGNGTYLFIPCGYSMFGHLYDFKSLFKRFPPPNYMITIDYEIQCASLPARQVIQMAMGIRELRMQNFTTPRLNDVRYVKIQRLVRENQRDLVLYCSADGRLVCNATRQDALWRTGQGVTWLYKANSTENIQVRSDCALSFSRLKLFEEDIYYCHVKLHSQTRLRRQNIWSVVPKIAYRLYIQQVTFRPPQSQHVLAGIFMLLIWSACLTLTWILLNVYLEAIQSKASLKVQVKQAGGRQTQLKRMYRPFMDEDRILFFKIMHKHLLDRDSSKSGSASRTASPGV